MILIGLIFFSMSQKAAILPMVCRLFYTRCSGCFFLTDSSPLRKCNYFAILWEFLQCSCMKVYDLYEKKVSSIPNPNLKSTLHLSEWRGCTNS